MMVSWQRMQLPMLMQHQAPRLCMHVCSSAGLTQKQAQPVLPPSRLLHCHSLQRDDELLGAKGLRAAELRAGQGGWLRTEKGRGKRQRCNGNGALPREASRRQQHSTVTTSPSPPTCERSNAALATVMAASWPSRGLSVAGTSCRERGCVAWVWGDRWQQLAGSSDGST